MIVYLLFASNQYEINCFLFYVLYISNSLECHVHLKLNVGKPMVLSSIKNLVFIFTLLSFRLS